MERDAMEKEVRRREYETEKAVSDLIRFPWIATGHSQHRWCLDVFVGADEIYTSALTSGLITINKWSSSAYYN